ncbi:glycoside hydrolase family 2 TIM barrel-domain containing protein [Paenibacillus sp. PL2-23]|uniref:glycosyl hydrolase 2 galactose-binding domain-containing protein n=1 Tax=Paenibacillus sp. PL2-23 TaxID=2100729 RepID=UPI0030FB4BCA
MTLRQSRNDAFADIAGHDSSNRKEGLEVPQPPVLEHKVLPLKAINGKEASSRGVFQPLQRMETDEQLHRELVQMREIHEPYMMDLAPEAGGQRHRLAISEFDWRIATEQDFRDFASVLEGGGEWERVTIPHYGAPLGLATVYYRTTVWLDESMASAEALFAVFRGVDYRAHLFVNGCFAGSHEGFFAPFEFEIKRCVQPGLNVLVIQVENDYVVQGSTDEKGVRCEGDKLYAATGPGYDEPVHGWHHCPPGMGIYQEMWLEARSRVYLNDIFVRPLGDLESAETWIEVSNLDPGGRQVSMEVSVYGQNFEEVVFENRKLEPDHAGQYLIWASEGMQENLTKLSPEDAARLLPGDDWFKNEPLRAEKGMNRFRMRFRIRDARLWEPATPWLYQIQVKLLDEHGRVVDTVCRQFGMRWFQMDETGQRKGKFSLNGKPIRLRGANTMGHEQQCVMKKDWDQLRDDLLYAKIARLNYLRLTQRPVQQEIYDLCDRLGVMTQTDLPLFGKLPRSRIDEALKQVGEMERLVRSHPCNIMVSYINEPFPYASCKPHRHAVRDEMERFFEAADVMIRLANPDRVIKAVDGDYDPPGPGLPDNHCYTLWYNGHGIDAGMLHKGYWTAVKPDWYYGCGEYGAEGLDAVETMLAHYPKEWLPSNPDAETEWSPSAIVQAQTGSFHYYFYDTPASLREWCRQSQKHQARATRWMTEAFRRDNRMVSTAIHLLIDAFPSGWMKAVMDCERRAKPAYFALRDALAPLLANLRSDRFAYTAGETAEIEAWICNDSGSAPKSAECYFMLEQNGVLLASGRQPAQVAVCGSRFQGYVQFQLPAVADRTPLTLRMGIVDDRGAVLNDTELELEAWPSLDATSSTEWSHQGLRERQIILLGQDEQLQVSLERESRMAGLLFKALDTGALEENVDNSVLFITDPGIFTWQEPVIEEAVRHGSHVILYGWPPGRYSIMGDEVIVQPCVYNAVHFVSRGTGHPLVADFREDDFRLWYDKEVDRITPIADSMTISPMFDPVLTTRGMDGQGARKAACVVGEKKMGAGTIVLCQLQLIDRAEHNPSARSFLQRLLRK